MAGQNRTLNMTTIYNVKNSTLNTIRHHQISVLIVNHERLHQHRRTPSAPPPPQLKKQRFLSCRCQPIETRQNLFWRWWCTWCSSVLVQTLMINNQKTDLVVSDGVQG